MSNVYIYIRVCVYIIYVTQVYVLTGLVRHIQYTLLLYACMYKDVLRVGHA